MHFWVVLPHIERNQAGWYCFSLADFKFTKVLLSTNNVTELRLSNIPNTIHFLSDDLVVASSTSVQLKSFAVGFYYPASTPPPSMTRRPRQRCKVGCVAGLVQTTSDASVLA